MENMEPTKAIDENSRHVSKLVHKFYFVKLCPTVPDSITKIEKDEKLIKTMIQDISEISDKIAKKTLEEKHRLNFTEWERRYRDKILLDLNMALDELNFRNVKIENGGWFGEKLDKNSLNYLRLHGSKSLGEEKKIIRDIKIQQKDVSPFKSLEVLKETILRKRRGLSRPKLVIEVEQFQIQHKERASMYDSLKKTIEENIKLLCGGDSLETRREWMKCERRDDDRKQVALIEELYSLNKKLAEKYKKRDEARHRISKLEKLYHEEILLYNKHCSLMNKVHQLAEEKDIAAIDEMSNSEIGKFMLEWNNNKFFREDYEKKLLYSLERRQLSQDGRRRPNKSCNIMFL